MDRDIDGSVPVMDHFTGRRCGHSLRRLRSVTWKSRADMK